ncbi:MAG: hypothetical protein HUK05_05380 [Prevotella sp.]|nr:hypothetical protein [Prevotella sp.]MCF0209544.1 hypothetical protein [Bacteroidaceae bacterium]
MLQRAKNFNIKPVFDRKKKATTDKTAAVQLEVCYASQQWFFPTGVYICKNQWSKSLRRVRNSAHQNDLNAIIDTKIKIALQYYNNGSPAKVCGLGIDFH